MSGDHGFVADHTSATPLLLVDVDGVISLFGFPMHTRPEGTFAMVEGIAHFLSATAGEHLRHLAQDFELAWCTGWEEKANEHLPQALGLPGPLPYVPLDRHSVPGSSVAGHWKLAPIDAFAGRDRPLAWVDDAHDDACRAWGQARPGPTLLCGTDPATGIGAQHVERLRAWARSLSERE